MARPHFPYQGRSHELELKLRHTHELKLTKEIEMAKIIKTVTKVEFATPVMYGGKQYAYVAVAVPEHQHLTLSINARGNLEVSGVKGSTLEIGFTNIKYIIHTDLKADDDT